MKRIALFLTLCLTASAQEAPKFFRLDFVVKEFDDNKPLSAKTYSTFMSTDERQKGASIRTGNKVSFSITPNTSFVDVGVNIDCHRLQEVNGQLIVQVQADVSSIPGGEILANTPALVRTNRWNASALIPIGKVSTLFSSDDQNSKRRMQIDLTATPVK